MIFVTGTGRSGTSTVARLLHQHSIACMGHRFHQPDGGNPKGYYEDLNFREGPLMTRLLSGNYINTFERDFRTTHRLCGCTSNEIGFKHPLLCGVSRQTWLEFKPTAIYLCTRPKEDTIASMIRYRKFKRGAGSYELAYKLYTLRQKDIGTNLIGLPFVHVLDFSEYRSDIWVLNRL